MGLPYTEDPNVQIPGQVPPLPAPGREAVGPMITDLVAEIRRATSEQLMLYRQALTAKQDRLVEFGKQFQTDGSGDGTVELVQVPAGYIGQLVIVTVDEAGIVASSPDTSANLWHGIYVCPGPGISAQASVVAQGRLRDVMPQSPVVDAQIPFVYLYGDRSSGPVARNGESFYFVVDGAFTNKVINVTGAMLVRSDDD